MRKQDVPVVLFLAVFVSLPIGAAGQVRVKGASAGFTTVVSVRGHFGVRATAGDPVTGLTEGDEFKIGSGFLYADEEAKVPAGVEIDANPLGEIPSEFDLKQNYPNPFNPVTHILIALPQRSRARVEVYNMIGQLVTVLIDRDLPAGMHRLEWDARDSTGRGVSSGMYIYRLVAGKFSRTRTMTLLK